MNTRHNILAQAKKRTILAFVFLFAFMPSVSMAAQDLSQGDPPPMSVIEESAESVEKPALELLPKETETENDETRVPPEPGEFPDDPDKTSKSEVGEEPQSAVMSVTSPSALSTNLTPSTIKQLLPYADETTGALIYSYPIAIPPGRNNVQPDVRLTYNNQQSEDGNLFGYGWSVSVPSIERLNKTGSDELYASQYFTSSLSGELVQLSANAYGSKVDNGEFLEYTLSNNTWTVRDKKGTVYTFGASSGSRQDNPSDISQVYKWMLSEIRDRNDNFVSFNYYKSDGQIYPQTIFYTGHGTTSGIFSVEFVREARPDVGTSYKTAFYVTTSERISEIQTKVNGSLSRSYYLGYSSGDNGARSVLTSITETGYDASSGSISLPPTLIEYQTSTSGWTQDVSWSVPLGFVFENSTCGNLGVRVADVNGDGLQDFLRSVMDSSNVYTQAVYLNTGSGWSLSTSWVLPQVPFAYGGGCSGDYGTQVVDINGDALADVLIYRANSNMYALEYGVYLNTGSGWAQDFTWTIPRAFNIEWADYGTRLADVNGDGLVDVLWNHGGISQGVAINNGSNWVVDSSWTVPVIIKSLNTGFIRGVEIVDVNNDGLADFIDANAGGQFVYINDGHGWALSTSWVFPSILRISDRFDYGTRLADVNGDALVDVVESRIPESSSVCMRETYLNTGSGWVLDPAWLTPGCFVAGGIGRDLGSRLFDVDGDGMADYLSAIQMSTGATISEVHLANGLRADRVNQVSSSTGGITDVTYKTPQQYTASSTPLNPATPFVFDTVYQLTRNDGLGTISSSTYGYEGGTYYFGSALDRRFAGFHIRTRTDSAGNLARDYFHQGNATNSSLGETSDHISKVGKIYRTEIQNASGSILSIVVNSWDRADIGLGRSFVKLASTLRLDYDGNATHRDRAVNYAYDNSNGNLSMMTEWGEVSGNSNGAYTDLGSDKRVTAVSYATNTPYHVLDLSFQEIVTDQSGAKVSEIKSYYDGLPLGSVNIGNQTREERWKTGATYIDTERTYNGFGFVTQELDPRNKLTNYVPDAYNLYPASISNALGHAVSYLYDYSSGRPTQITEPNGGIAQTTYDALDRPVEEKQSNSTSASVLETKTTYQHTPQTVGWRTKQSVWLDASISKDAYSYTDGFDRLIQTRAEAETANTFSTADTIYDSREYIWKQSLPYFSTGISRTSPTTTPSLLSTFIYDALGRATSIANAVGSTSSSYDQWMTNVTDPTGTLKTFTKDAYDRLVAVAEHNASSTYTTSYQYNLRGDLTQIIDALGNIRSFTYDGLSRRITAQDLHAPSDTAFGTWTYTYDDSGNLASTLDPKNQTVQYAYDDLNRVLTENYTSATGVEVTNAYDSCANGIGRLCSVTKTGFSESDSYDELGRITSQTRTIDGTPYATSFAYDRQGNTTLITNPDNSQVQYVYNGAGLLNSVNRKENAASFTQAISNIDYSPTGKRTVISYANGAVTTNSYDVNELYRLRTKVTSASSGNQQHLTYYYDANGNITQIVDASNTQSAKTTSYTYDDLNRLLSASVTGSANGQNGAQTYTYDAIGNISSRSDIVGSYEYYSTAPSSYSNPHAATTVGTTTNTYDQNGNLATSTTPTTTTSTPSITPLWYAGTPGTWAKRLPLTIQQSQISGTTALTNFPVLVSITSTNLRSTSNGGFVANTSGNDILFTSSDGTTKLDHEIESYNAATGVLIAWVRVPSLSATVNTAVYLYFGNPSASSQQNSTGVWETNYKGVWHLKENPSVTGARVNDSTSNGYYGTPYGSMPASASATAKVGLGLTFDGTDDNLHLGSATAIGNLTNNFTVSVWIRPTNLTGARRIISPRRLNSNNGFGFGTNGSNPRLSTYGVKEYSLTSALTLNSWQRLDVVLQNNNASYYRNGVLLGTVAHTSGGLANTDDYLRIGATSPVGVSTYTEMFMGSMDELRVYSGTRTSNWIQAEYNNQNAPATFVTAGTVQSVPVPVTTTTNVTTTYNWDYGNRLISIASPSLSASFVYDHNGTRVKSVLGGTTTKYPTSSYSIVGTTPTKHVSLDDGELVLTVEGTGSTATPSYIHTDHLTGSAVITSSTGSQVQLLDYHPFGNLRINNQSSSFNEKRKFAGHEYDTETGLSYMQARYYNPAVGKFISEDPAFLGLGTNPKLLDLMLSDPQAQNSYAYARNNPLSYRDPDGNVVETVVDIGFLAYDFGKFVYNDVLSLGASFAFGYGLLTGNNDLINKSASFINGNNANISRGLIDTAVDVAGTFIPGVPVVGLKAGIKVVGSTADVGRGVNTYLKHVDVKSFGKTVYSGQRDLGQTLDNIQKGTLEGKTFINAKSPLPKQPVGYYTEFEIKTPNWAGSNKGPERIIQGKGGEYYYTPDHYKSFTPLNK